MSALHVGGSRPSAARGLAATITLACAVLSGCARPTDTAAIKSAGDQMRSIRQQCEERRENGALKTVTEVERCAEPGVIAAYQEAGYPYMDLIRFAEDARLAGAQKVDAGEISEAEYERQRLLLRDRLASEINRRNTESPPHHYPETPDQS